MAVLGAATKCAAGGFTAGATFFDRYFRNCVETTLSPNRS
jgi:hypothetical protein